MDKKIFVDFYIKVDETIRLVRESENKKFNSVTEIFCLQNTYFLYTYHRQIVYKENAQPARQFTYSLREITKEEYVERRDEFLEMIPETYIKTDARIKWVDDAGNTLTLSNYFNYRWQCTLTSQDCIFITENNLLRKIVARKVAEVNEQRTIEQELDAADRMDYAKRCGAMSRKYSIDFINVLRIGTDEHQLICFKESYANALEQVKQKTPQELRELYMLLFNKGHEGRMLALKKLGIEVFNASVGKMNLDELKKAIQEGLDVYLEAFQRSILPKLLEADEETRQFYYLTLRPGTHKSRRELLIQLGLDMNSVIFRRIKLSIVLDALAKSLGITRSVQKSVIS